MCFGTTIIFRCCGRTIVSTRRACDLTPPYPARHSVFGYRFTRPLCKLCQRLRWRIADEDVLEEAREQKAVLEFSRGERTAPNPISRLTALGDRIPDVVRSWGGDIDEWRANAETDRVDWLNLDFRELLQAYQYPKAPDNAYDEDEHLNEVYRTAEGSRYQVDYVQGRRLFPYPDFLIPFQRRNLRANPDLGWADQSTLAARLRAFDEMARRQVVINTGMAPSGYDQRFRIGYILSNDERWPEWVEYLEPLIASAAPYLKLIDYILYI